MSSFLLVCRDEIRSQSTTYERWIPPSAIRRDALPENSDDVKFRKVSIVDVFNFYCYVAGMSNSCTVVRGILNLLYGLRNERDDGFKLNVCLTVCLGTCYS